jgi:hypothetical protein
MTPNQKAWQREMLRIENMARSIGIEDVASIKPKTPDKITKKHIAQAEAITMDYVREKAELESAGIKPTKRAKQKKGKSVGGTKKPDYVHKPRRPLTEEEKKQRAENLRRGRERLTHDQLSESAKKGAGKRKGSGKKAAQTRKEKFEQIKNLPRVSDIAVDNFFSEISERLSAPQPSDDVSAVQYYFDAMTGLLHDIGRNRFASMLMLADQDGAGIYLHLPPSKVDKEWVMGAITAFYGVVSKHNLGYGKRVRDIWEEMDERNDSYEFEEDETI